MRTIACALLLLVLGLAALMVVLAVVALVLVAMAKISPILGVFVLIGAAAFARTFTDWKPRGFLE